MESGLPMQFPDGEKSSPIYPEITIPRSAFRTSPNPYDTGNKAVAVRMESTIGVMGTGLLDAITEDDLKDGEKVVRINEAMPGAKFEKVFSDSLKSDAPIFALGEINYHAVRGKLTRIK